MKFAIIIVLIYFIFCGLNTLAESQFSPSITKIEKSLFEIDYPNQSDEARLNRIEERIYGEISKKSTAQRLARLNNDISVDLLGKEIEPKEDTFADDTDYYNRQPQPKEEGNINYPIVNQLEQNVFNRDYKGVDIDKRLSALEQKIFKATYKDDLHSRVERIKQAIMPQNKLAQHDDDYETGFGSDIDPSSLMSESTMSKPRYNQSQSVLDDYPKSNDIGIKLAALEMSILKKAYADDSISNRLTRLERSVFQSEYSQDAPAERLDRLNSVQRAKKSSKKYDDNKFSQKMSTAMQIGAMILMVLACIL